MGMKKFSREFFAAAGRRGGRRGSRADKIRAARTRWDAEAKRKLSAGIIRVPTDVGGTVSTEVASHLQS